MRVSFNLREGMTSDDVLKELKGRTSGESRQELVPFFVENKGVEDIPLASHQILKANDEYAVVLHRRMWKNSLGVLYIENHYYLSGINDEGKYFAHSITDTSGWWQGIASLDIERLLSWLNRQDEGYSLRVQGDLLLQFVSQSALRGHDRPESSRVTFEMPMPPSENHLPVGTMTHELFKSPTPRRQITLGNHRVSTNGEIFTLSYGGDKAIITGTALVLQHPEHGLKTLDIPSGHIAIMTGQRGRPIHISGNRGTGFD